MSPLVRRLRNALRREAHDLLHGGPPTADLLRPVGPNVPVGRAGAAGARPVHERRGGAAVQRGTRRGDHGHDDADGRRLRAAHRGRRHHLHLDHHVLPPGHGGAAGDDDAAGPPPRDRPHPAGHRGAHRAAGGAGAAGRARRGGGAGRGGGSAAPLPALGGDPGLGRAGRRRSPAARRAADHRARRVRGHRAASTGSGGGSDRWGVAPFFLQLVGGMVATGRHARSVRPPACCRPAPSRRWSSRPASPCCCPGCRSSARCRTRSPPTT